VRYLWRFGRLRRALVWHAGAIALVSGGYAFGAVPGFRAPAAAPFAGTATPRPGAVCPHVLAPHMRGPFGTMARPVTFADYQLVGCWVGMLTGKAFVYDEYVSHQYGAGIGVSYDGHVVAHVNAGAGGAPLVVHFMGTVACWSEQAGAWFFALNLQTGATMPTRLALQTCPPPHWPPRSVLGLRGQRYPWGIELRLPARRPGQSKRLARPGPALPRPVVSPGLAHHHAAACASTSVRTVPVGLNPITVAVDEGTRRAFVVTWGRYPHRGRVSVLDTVTGNLLRSVTVGVWPRRITVAAQAGRVFITNTGPSSPDGPHETVSVLDAASGHLLATLPGGDWLIDVVVDDTSGLAFIAAADLGWAGHISVVDARSGRLVRTIHLPGPPAGMALDTAARRVVVTDYGKGTANNSHVMVLDARTGRVLRTVLLDGSPSLVVVDRHAGHAFVAAAGLRILETRGGALLSMPPIALHPAAMVVNESTGRLYALIQGAPDTGYVDSLAVLDTHSGRLLRTFRVGRRAGPMAVDPASGRLFLTVGDTLTVCAAATGALLRTVPVGRDPAALLLDEHRGHLLVLTGITVGRPGNRPNHGTLSVVETRSGALLSTVAVGAEPATMALDAQSGRSFVTNDASNTVSEVCTS